MIKEFYIYLYLDPTKPGKYTYNELNFSLLYEPFYVGKGSGYRLKKHLCESNRNKKGLKNNKINKILNNNLEPIIIKLFENLDENTAFELEIKLIEIIGRRDLKQGPLCNLTNGGEGESGHILSEEHKERIRQSLLKLNLSPPQKNMKYEDFYGWERAKEIKKKQSESNLGKINKYKGKSLSEIHGVDKSIELINNLKNKNTGINNPFYNKKHTKETKKKLSESHLGLKNNSKTFIFIDGSQREYVIIGEFKKFCKEKELPWATMFNISKNKRKNKFYNGWTVFRK